jgi:hypothetical protein
MSFTVATQIDKRTDNRNCGQAIEIDLVLLARGDERRHHDGYLQHLGARLDRRRVGGS